MNFEDIYRLDVIQALENDNQLDFKDIGDTYLQKGVCPKCGHRTLYVSRKQPFQLACNRLNECRHTEKTRERYSYLFENLSERFPSTEANPTATADAYLQRNRGFDTSRMKDWYSQERRKLADESWGDTVRFPLCDGYWERLIDARALARNDGNKAGIKWKMNYKGQGWVPPGQTFEKNDRVYVVEGIFHAIALYLAGYKAIAAISCNNFPWQIIEANQGKLITWCIALDNDKAGRAVVSKYLAQIRKMKEIGWVVLGEPGRDWDDVYRDGQLDSAYMQEAEYQGRLFTATSPLDKAYVMHTKRNRPFYLVEFGNCLYVPTQQKRRNIPPLQLGNNVTRYDQLADTLARFNALLPVPDLVRTERRARHLSKLEAEKWEKPSAGPLPRWGALPLERCTITKAAKQSMAGQLAVLEGYAADSSPMADLAALAGRKAGLQQARDQKLADLQALLAGGTADDTMRARLIGPGTPAQLRAGMLEGEAPGHEWVLSAGMMLVGSLDGLSFVRELVGL